MMTTMNEFVREIKRLEAIRYSAPIEEVVEANKAYYDMVDLAISTPIEDALCVPTMAINALMDADPFLMFDEELMINRAGVAFSIVRVDNKEEFYQKYLRETF